MLTENKIKEELNLAYILAISASKSFGTEISRIDYDSVDVTVKYAGKLADDSTLYSPELQLQLKATSGAEIIGDNIHFPLPIKNYNDLRQRSANPRFLVVMCLPSEVTHWLSHSEEELIVKKCAYFLSLKGAAETTNTSTVTVHIPLTNLLSPDKLHELMVQCSKEEL